MTIKVLRPGTLPGKTWEVTCGICSALLQYNEIDVLSSPGFSLFATLPPSACIQCPECKRYIYLNSDGSPMGPSSDSTLPSA